MVKQAAGIRILALNAVARQAGLRPGMRLADARALLPTLATKFAQPEADAQALLKLAKWSQRYTPIVNVDGSERLWLDITGVAHLFGSEKALLQNLQKRLDAMGFETQLGLAETPGAAWAIATFPSEETARIITPGNLVSALAPLPIDALRLDQEALYLLGRFGLKTIGALAALPRPSLKRRFPSRDIGEAVLKRLDQAFGTLAEPITPLRPQPAYFEHLIFAEPILATESFHQGLRQLLTHLTKRMEADNIGATRLEFSAYHADGGLSQIAIAIARPSYDQDHLAYLFRDRIDAINPGFGVDVLALAALAIEAHSARQMVFSASAANSSAQQNMAQLIDRLANRLGAHRVQRIAFHQSHIPERAENRISALKASPPSLSPSLANTANKPLRPSRLLAQPEPLQVMVEVPEGPPMRFTWRRMTYRVVRSEGPERIAPEWWLSIRHKDQTPPRTRDYYRVEDDQGRNFWVFREGLYDDKTNTHLPTWHMHGLYV